MDFGFYIEGPHQAPNSPHSTSNNPRERRKDYWERIFEDHVENSFEDLETFEDQSFTGWFLGSRLRDFRKLQDLETIEDQKT